MTSPVPKISVVMPVHNGEKFLREAISSILNQTEKNIELIVVDDGSTDSTESIVKSYTDDRLKYYQQNHKGIICALNFGFTQSRAEYIARMDADDIACPERLSKQLAYMIEHELVLCGSWVDLIDEDGSPIGSMRYPPVVAGPVRMYALLHNPFIHPTIMIRKDIFIKVGGYMNFTHVEDYELWTRIIFKYHVGNIPEKLLKYRLHNLQVTRRKNQLMRAGAYAVRACALWRFVYRW